MNAKWIAIALWLVATPALAQTNLTGMRVDMTNADDVVVHVLASGDLLAPRIRAQGRTVRAWFPNIDNNARIAIPGDQTAIETLSLAPGVGDTAVLRLDLLGRARHGDVRFATTPTGGMLLLARSLFAGLAEDSAEAGEEIKADDTPLATTATPRPSEVEEPEAEAEATGETEAPHAESEAGVGVASSDADATSDSQREAGTPLFANRSESSHSASEQAGGGSSMGTLALIALLLGAIYLVVRFITKKKTIRIDEDIDVVASKRLGPRYQLVVVRALGQDHLLALHKGQTQLISSSEPDASPLALPERPRREGASDLIESLQQRLGEDRVQLSSRVGVPSRFGAKLLDFAKARTEVAVATSEPESEAVAGLLRLRRVVGE